VGRRFPPSADFQEHLKDPEHADQVAHETTRFTSAILTVGAEQFLATADRVMQLIEDAFACLELRLGDRFLFPLARQRPIAPARSFGCRGWFFSCSGHDRIARHSFSARRTDTIVLKPPTPPAMLASHGPHHQAATPTAPPTARATVTAAV
jgi:hypothetical protein